jgi:hypothetical protein
VPLVDGQTFRGAIDARHSIRKRPTPPRRPRSPTAMS